MYRLELSDLKVTQVIELDLGEDFHQALNRETVIECLSKMWYFDEDYEEGVDLHIDNQVFNYIGGSYSYIDGLENKCLLIFKLIRAENGGLYFYSYHNNKYDNNYILYILT